MLRMGLEYGCAEVSEGFNQRQRRLNASRLKALLAEHPHLKPRYEAAKQVVRAFRRPGFYEVAERCNLFCEGCYYFSDSFKPRVGAPLAAWEDFFLAEAERGVSMAYFVGAEPALEQERLLAAAPHFPHGNIGTNGSIRIDPAVPYRIGVSVWATTSDSDRRLRGANVFQKAFRNYAGDRRAIILFTITRSNIGELATVAQMCRDHGLPLTFNLYSPTRTYLDKLAGAVANDRRFFRISRPEESLRWDDESLAAARRAVLQVMEDYPETVIYSKAYNSWSTRPGPLYDIDPTTGIARDCHSRMVEPMRYFKVDLQAAPEKCGTSDADCSECRMYSGGWSSKFEPRAEDLTGERSFADWLEMMRTLGRIFLIERQPIAERTSNRPAAAPPAGARPLATSA
jgi:hypothetical protein